jgi:hypothetical protein
LNGVRPLAFAALEEMNNRCAMPDEDKPSDTDGKPTQAEATRLDEAHEAAGDGTLQGSVPAGLIAEELRRRAEKKNPGADAATD